MANDLRFALRMILTHRWFSAAVVVTLALGIGANTMVFTLVDAVLLRPVAVPGGERLVALSYSNPSRGDHGMRMSFRTSVPTAKEAPRSNPSRRPAVTTVS